MKVKECFEILWWTIDEFVGCVDFGKLAVGTVLCWLFVVGEVVCVGGGVCGNSYCYVIKDM